MSVHGRRSHQPRGRRACGRRLFDVSVGGTRRPGLRGRGRYRQDDVVVDRRRSSTRTRLRGVVRTGGFGRVGAGHTPAWRICCVRSTSRRGRTYPSRNVSLSTESCCGAPKPIPRRISGLLPQASWLSSGGSRQGSPVILAIDDLQWLDPSSLQVVGFAARRLSGPGRSAGDGANRSRRHVGRVVAPDAPARIDPPNPGAAIELSAE